MTAKKQPRERDEAGRNQPGAGPSDAGDGRAGDSAEASGPQAAGPWGWADGFDQDPPWGLGEDSPLDEGSEPTAVPGGRRGERRAGADGRSNRHGFGSVEPSRVPEAGPGTPPDPAPPRRPFPTGGATGELPDEAVE
jgi:hypothetical protein